MRDQGPHGPDLPPPSGDGERPPAPVSYGRFGEPRPGGRPDDEAQDHGDHGGHNGHPAPHPVGRRISEIDDESPVDLVELQADDELITALSSGLGPSGPGNRGYDVDDRLVSLLSSWKDDVEREPIPDLVGTDEAVEMLQPAKPSRKVSFLRPLVAAVAVAACALAVVSIGAHEARPGDTLWGVSKVLYSERAEQVQAASDLRTGIERVNAKLAEGDTAGAQAELETLGPLVGKTDPDMRDEFQQQNRFLTAKVAETPPGTPTDPRAPLRNGTPAPPPPATSEGNADERPAPPAQQTRPGTPAPGGASSGSASPEGTSPGSASPGSASSGSTSPEGSSPGSPSPEGTSPGGNDPSVLSGPEGESTGPSPTTSAPTPPESSPTTEGSPDPSTSTTPTTPTASGEGGADQEEPTSSTSTGAVSSTPN